MSLGCGCFEHHPRCQSTLFGHIFRLVNNPGYNVVKATELAYGLAQVQFTGPWSQPEVHPKVSYLHTHWIGLATTPKYGLLVYEINAGGLEHTRGQWVPMAFWESEVLPLLLTQHPRADGGYHFRWTCELYI